MTDSTKERWPHRVCGAWDYLEGALFDGGMCPVEHSSVYNALEGMKMESNWTISQLMSVARLCETILRMER